MWICVKESMVALLSGEVVFPGNESVTETCFSCRIFIIGTEIKDGCYFLLSEKYLVKNDFPD